MKTLLKRSTLLLGLITCVSSYLPLPALSMPRHLSLLFELSCKGGYQISIYEQNPADELLYRATTPSGELNLGNGSRKNTDEAQVYSFKNSNYEYKVIRGTGDNRDQGSLQVYKNGRNIMHRSCTPS